MMGRDLIASIACEWRKQRRGLAAWLIPATGLLVPVINLLLRLKRPGSLPGLYQDDLFWHRLSAQAWEPMAVMILPLGAILVTGLVTQVEHCDGGWKQLHATPVSPTAIYLAKLLAAMAMVFLTVAVFYLGVLVVGVAPRLMVDGVPYPTSPFPAAEFIRRDLLYFVDVLPVVAVQFALGLLLGNALAPVGIGLALWIGSASTLGWKLNYLLPYGYSSIDHFLDTGKRVGRGAPTEIWILALGAFLATAVAGYVGYRAKPERG